MLGNEAAEAGLWSIRSAWRRAVSEALAQRYGQTPGGQNYRESLALEPGLEK